MIGVLKGTGVYIPAHVLNNDDLSKMVETNDEWIRERTGVVTRHVIEDETTVFMAAEAAKAAIADAGIMPQEIDLIIVATISSNVILPCTACEVQKEVGAINAACFDMNAACTGFLFACNTAQAYIQSGMYKCVLIIGAESLSNLVDWTDRGTCILFGDGAGAAIMCAEEEAQYVAVTHSDGIKGSALECESRHRKGWEKKLIGDTTYMRMDGQAVFKFAVKKVPEVIEEVLEKAGVQKVEISYYILHQANKRIVESVAKRLKEPIGKFPMNLYEYGNTSSASIPILLDELKKNGTLKRGQKIVMAGFGAGLSWGAAVLIWE